MYAAARAYLKYCILRNFAFYNFFEYLNSLTSQKNWTTFELFEIPDETVTFTKVLRKNVVIVIFKKCILLDFTFNFC